MKTQESLAKPERARLGDAPRVLRGNTLTALMTHLGFYILRPEPVMIRNRENRLLKGRAKRIVLG